MGRTAIIAIGGNSLIRNKNKVEVADQYQAIKETTRQIADLIEIGYDVVITHGNGPQVGYILRRSEIAAEHGGLHRVPLITCVADTQGAIGFYIQQALNNEFKKRKINKQAVTIVTQVEVKGDDRAFHNPSKPIGPFYSGEQMEKLETDHPDWAFTEDSGRGFRRVVPSPKPIDIIEKPIIDMLVGKGYCVVACGGGGIPVVTGSDGMLDGVDAVIDKDAVSMLLARALKAELLVFSTGVDKLCLNFGTPDQKELDRISTRQTRQYLEQGHFGVGSMMPKVEAAIRFVEQGGKKAIITRPDNLREAVLGKCGSHISDGE